jgi:hypothetical protein
MAAYMHNILGAMASAFGPGSAPSTSSNISRSSSGGVIASHPASLAGPSVSSSVYSSSSAAATAWGAGSTASPEEVEEFFNEGYTPATFDVAARYYRRFGAAAGFNLRDYWEQNKYNFDQHVPLEKEETYQETVVGHLIRLEEVAQVYPDVPMTDSMVKRSMLILTHILEKETSFLGWTYKNLQDFAVQEDLWSYSLHDLECTLE